MASSHNILYLLQVDSHNHGHNIRNLLYNISGYSASGLRVANPICNLSSVHLPSSIYHWALSSSRIDRVNRIFLIPYLPFVFSPTSPLGNQIWHKCQGDMEQRSQGKKEFGGWAKIWIYRDFPLRPQQFCLRVPYKRGTLHYLQLTTNWTNIVTDLRLQSVIASAFACLT